MTERILVVLAVTARHWNIKDAPAAGHQLLRESDDNDGAA